ncbi:MAG: hypothetical protein N2504_02310 [candidate division WOR-3 bacterium]|nr:hypothetical protein [candidate division WOR-3 bacterium]MCX7947407.1 hypothetical protein [candidate division WOR-3 bacterium]MDW8151195.1 hypothetical protein [candidate division WOR-3 bacterium]
MKISVSGIRGIYPDEINPYSALVWTNAFCNFLEGKNLVISRDTRLSGKVLYPIVLNTALSTCKNVYTLSVCPTPTTLYIIKSLSLDGGIIITASHNPSEYNALKLAIGDRFLFEDELEVLKSYLGKMKFSSCIGEVVYSENAYKLHLDSIVDFVGFKLVNSNMKIGIDCVNGATYKVFPELLEKFGIRNIIKINCEDSGIFTRNPEPRPEYLKSLEGLLDKCDLVFATDPDGDRLVFGVKNYGILSEELTLVVGISEILEREKGDIVVNYSTTILVEFIAREYGVNVIRSKVGEANVLRKIIEINGIAGGEGNGGIIYPKFNKTRDGLLSLGLILNSYIEGRLIKILNNLPKTYNIKEKVENVEFEKLKSLFLGEFKDFEKNLEDGLYLRKNNSWIHIRPSNTEPIIRIYAESLDKNFYDYLLEFIKFKIK